MAQLKVRVRLNPGRHGAPLDKLGEFSTQMERFLRSLANDLGLTTKKRQWLAVKFQNESVSYDAEFAEPVTDEIASQAQAAFATISSKEPLAAFNRGLVSYTTVAEFAQLGKSLDPDESFFLGIYNGAKAPNWQEVSHKKTAEIRQLLAAPLVTTGSVQGVLHAWHNGSSPPFFTVRELSTGALVRCVYGESLYNKVHKAHAKPRTVVHVYGQVEWDRITSAIKDLKVSDIDIADPLNEFDFERLFGSAPEATGTMSTAEYIDWVRGEDE